eukprot:GHVS01007557.1.p1 GENE.GHVS01007557.1~~GHVS01007557.1.p1  ORF type:complete len:358 (-),score=44.75 GHVS01007557.1:265-1338(-)
MGDGADNRTTIGCGLASGAIQSSIFNPWDRAMYLSVKSRRSFFDRANWKQPYQGFGQAVIHRTLANGLYFPCETFFIRFFERRRHEWFSRQVHESRPSVHPHISSSELFVVGILSGACSGFLLHPLSAIKYRCWGFESTPTFSSAIAKFYSAGQLRNSLSRGLVSTVQRDIIFGGCFCFFRHQDSRHRSSGERTGDNLETHPNTDQHSCGGGDSHSSLPSSPLITTPTTNPSLLYATSTTSSCPVSSSSHQSPPSWLDRCSQFAHNFVAAGVGVALASPINFVRNVEFSYKVGQTVPSSIAILRTLVSDCLRENQQLLARVRWLRKRLLVGVGTFRVAFGMAVGAQVYSLCIQEDWD